MVLQLRNAVKPNKARCITGRTSTCHKRKKEDSGRKERYRNICLPVNTIGWKDAQETRNSEDFRERELWDQVQEVWEKNAYFSLYTPFYHMNT